MAGDVSAVVVSYGHAGVVAAAVASLAVLGDDLGEVLVVDNAGDLTRPLPAVGAVVPEILTPGSNLGFAAAINLALERARGSLILLLSPDAEVLSWDPDGIRRELGPGIGAVGAATMDREGRSSVSWGDFPGLGRALGRLTGARGRGRREILAGLERGRGRVVDWVLGAAVVLRRADLVAVGGLDPAYVTCGDDQDLGARLLRRGLASRVSPVWRVRHEPRPPATLAVEILASDRRFVHAHGSPLDRVVWPLLELGRRRSGARPLGWRLAAAALGLAVVLALVEVGARVLGEEPRRSAEFEVTVHVGEWRVVERRRLAEDPLLVTELVPGQRQCVPDGCLSINHHGFRRSPAAPPLGAPGEVAIAMVGDSFVYGYGVNDDQTLPSQLESLFHQRGYPRVRVLNLGVNGYNAVQSARVLAGKAGPLAPRIVVYAYSRNDTELFWQEGNPTLWEVAPLFAGAPLSERVLVRSRAFEALWRRFAHRVRGRGDMNAYFAFLHRPSWPGLWATRQSLAAMRAEAERLGAGLVVALLPDEMTAEDARGTTGRIAALCAGLGVATVNLLDPYLGHPDRVSLRTRHGPIHFNGRGNELIAGGIYDDLQARYGEILEAARLE